ncbi:GNAT family N-acetyltransferase [Novosphingobium sp. AAP83]|uniref:GNAT family N-acetyltransferase n=1 Tax=Novosphingobium sp. AAP83 TaxID=1523425 RepID=UPI000A4D0CD6|nr:GNAT family N-acetyltransferase [Novosphingobium sp. AAP83]
MDKAIIELGQEHRQKAVHTLSMAFAHDPAMAWMFPDSVVRARRLPLLMDWMFVDHLRHGMVLGTPGCEAVTLWRPPGTVHDHTALTPLSALRFVRMLGTAVLRADRIDRRIGHHLPAGEQQFYLRMAAVRADRQGQGLGGLVIRAGLEHSDKAGLPAVLETATQSNVGLYRALGFDVISNWKVARDGPQFWTMQRASTR